MSPRQDSYFDIFDGVKIRESGESSQLENYIKYYLLIKRWGVGMSVATTTNDIFPYLENR